nr:unnamed protein product [Callosobruchus chinensis]
MYELYVEWCNENEKVPAKESYYRFIFCTEFNLEFHKPHSDTCNTCDRLNNLIKNTRNDQANNNYTLELELHHRKVQSVTAAKKRDLEYAKQNSETVRLICFDLEKTIATPLLTTNKYIQDLPTQITHLICYSDSCGGQNKNKNIAKLLMFLVQSSQLQTIDHKFFESGHSYMECDRSFGLIERNAKKNPQKKQQKKKKTNSKKVTKVLVEETVESNENEEFYEDNIVESDYEDD